MESVGFKEWSLVCDALGRGTQSVILRKGGIAEGRGGFSFRHREFFLFPTFFHEQIAKVRIAGADIPVPGSTIAIRWYAKVERALRIDSLAIAEALALLHILSAEVVGERFGYKGDGLNVAFVRVFEISPVSVSSLEFGTGQRPSFQRQLTTSNNSSGSGSLCSAPRLNCRS